MEGNIAKLLYKYIQHSYSLILHLNKRNWPFVTCGVRAACLFNRLRKKITNLQGGRLAVKGIFVHSNAWNQTIGLCQRIVTFWICCGSLQNVHYKSTIIKYFYFHTRKVNQPSTQQTASLYDGRKYLCPMIYWTSWKILENLINNNILRNYASAIEN